MTELKNSKEALRKSTEERLKQGEVSWEKLNNLMESATDLGEFREEELYKFLEDMDRIESQSSNYLPKNFSPTIKEPTAAGAQEPCEV